MTVLTIIRAVVTEQCAQALVAPAVTCADALAQLAASGYTGRVTLDFHDGHPRRLEIPNPVLVRLVDRRRRETVLHSST